MEVREKKVTVTRKEMLGLRKMDHRQLEEELTELYVRGYVDGHKAAGFLTAEAEKKQDEKWQQAVEQALDDTKGIGQSRRELFMERLRLTMEGK